MTTYGTSGGGLKPKGSIVEREMEPKSSLIIPETYFEVNADDPSAKVDSFK